VLDLWTDLLSCLDLRPVPSGGAGEEHAGDDVAEFEGRNQQLDYHRVFGGRSFGRGDVLSEDGSLVASYAQEALLRFSEAQ
jgi:hypothetical protein